MPSLTALLLRAVALHGALQVLSEPEVEILQLESYQAALARDHEDPSALRELLASVIECSSLPNYTSDELDARALETHANAEQALRDGDIRGALRHTCSLIVDANGTVPPSHRTVCLGHSLAASRSPGGRPYARMVVLATQPLLVRDVRAASSRPWEAVLSAKSSRSPAVHGRLVGHTGDGSKPLHSVFRVDRFLTVAESALLLDTAKALGTWTLASHTPYPTSDIHLSDLAVGSEDAAMQRWVGMWIVSRLYPMLAGLYDVSPGSLWLKEAVLIKYLAPSPISNISGRDKRVQVPAGVGEHRDASVLSFNILLNDASELVEGGGTLFPQLRPAKLEEDGATPSGGSGGGGGRHLQGEMSTASGKPGNHIGAGDPRVVRLKRGDMVVHSGKALHAGVPLQREGSERYLLAGFVQLCGRCE